MKTQRTITTMHLSAIFLAHLSTSANLVIAASKASNNTAVPTSSSCKDLDSCRSTQEIVYGCLATIFACVWVAVHPNIPKIPDTAKPWQHKLLVSVFNMYHSVGTVILAVFIPELMLNNAAQQYGHAGLIARALEKASQQGAATPLAKTSRRETLALPSFGRFNNIHSFSMDNNAWFLREHGRLSFF